MSANRNFILASLAAALALTAPRVAAQPPGEPRRRPGAHQPRSA